MMRVFFGIWYFWAHFLLHIEGKNTKYIELKKILFKRVWSHFGAKIFKLKS